MEQDFIESLSVEDLNVYASSPSIKAAVSYFVVDGVSGEMTCISEEEALRGAAAVTSDPAIGEMAQDLYSGHLYAGMACGYQPRCL